MLKSVFRRQTCSICPTKALPRMANVFSDAQIKALLKVVNKELKVVNKEKGGLKKFVEVKIGRAHV